MEPVRQPCTSLAFEPALSQRRRTMLELIASAQRYAHSADDEEAQRIAAFLEQRALVGVPLANDQIAIREVDRARLRGGVVVVPVVGLDNLVVGDGEAAKLYALPAVSKTALGSYYRDAQAIYVSVAWSTSLFWQMLILLHEGLHAYQHLVDRDLQDDRTHREQRERAAQALQNRVLYAIGGEAFAKLVRGWRSLSPDGRSDAALRRVDEALDACFGAAISKSDRSVQYSYLAQCAEPFDAIAQAADQHAR
jgi:hypothetical protein